MSEFVEGEWKDFVFKMITEEDHPKVLRNLLDVFCKDAPLMVAAECSESEEMLHDFATFSALVLKQDLTHKLSFCAWDKRTGEIAGVRITSKATPKNSKTPLFQYKSAKLEAIIANIHKLEADVNLFEQFGIDHYAEFIFTSVNPEYRRLGLATEMYKRSFALLGAKGYPLCKSNFGSPYTQELALRLGFQECGRWKLTEFVYPNGTWVMDSDKVKGVQIVMARKL